MLIGLPLESSYAWDVASEGFHKEQGCITDFAEEFRNTRPDKAQKVMVIATIGLMSSQALSISMTIAYNPLGLGWGVTTVVQRLTLQFRKREK